MSNKIIFSLIKTSCGRAKYNDLASKEGFIAKARLAWFILIASIRDLNIKNNQ
ncbi:MULTISPECIES: hypothetical protein [unclassified Prochlorococcus]|uniref:hypothetical protein n=1 Tax=unclassified Prochlorococcus TaxID=2627481 RepID=UPI0005339B58|nr:MULTISPECIES: hypothetical protein [unclassified Prochlorococcus]KGG14542.1 hypothetical protein EV06_1599 [Prochlorococcus sp. MIT 0602]KGG16033.1 hypothetical protein EV07_2001 [Prochlorococcus sp. MIT 0603]